MHLDQELVIDNGEVVGTTFRTDHTVLMDARFELPYGQYYCCYDDNYLMAN